jgi:hypothetical protein
MSLPFVQYRLREGSHASGTDLRRLPLPSLLRA